MQDGWRASQSPLSPIAVILCIQDINLHNLATCLRICKTLTWVLRRYRAPTTTVLRGGEKKTRFAILWVADLHALMALLCSVRIILNLEFFSLCCGENKVGNTCDSEGIWGTGVMRRPSGSLNRSRPLAIARRELKTGQWCGTGSDLASSYSGSLNLAHDS